MTRARGTGHVFQPKYRNTAGELVTANTWAFTYYNRRRRKPETVFGHRTEAAAEKALRAKLAAQDRGQAVGSDVERTRFVDLAKAIRADYVSNAHDSLPRLNQSIAHLEQWFGEDRAVDITSGRVEIYKAGRIEEGAKPATVNRELSALKRMFNLCEERVPRRPKITMLAERNVRKGYFEEHQFRAVLAKLPEHLRPVVRVAYVTGWRMQSEILSRQWRHVDFEGGFLRLEPGEAKSERPRLFPLDPELRPVLQALRDQTDAIEREDGRVIPWVFYERLMPSRRIRRIGRFRTSWLAACKAAGAPGRWKHDFRRTALRNLRRGGVDVLLAMEMVGWSSFAMVKRYAITDEAMLKAAAEKLAQSRHSR